MKSNSPREHTDTPSRGGNENATGVATLHDLAEQTRAQLARILPADAAPADHAEQMQEGPRTDFLELRKSWDRCIQAEKSESAQSILDALYSYFLERELHIGEPNNFALQDAHNMLSRDFENPDFLKQLLARIVAEKSEEMDRNTNCLVTKATEFEANRKRRLGFHLINNCNDIKQGTQLVAEAETTFKAVLEEWKKQENVPSQVRTLYELAQIATERKEWQKAANWHKKSAEVAKTAGLPIDECIAYMKQDEARLKGNLSPAITLVENLETHTTTMRELASTTGDAIAKRWVANALFHQAEAWIKAAKDALAESDTESARRYKETATQCHNDIANDKDGYSEEINPNDTIGMKKALASLMQKIEAIETN